MACSHKIFSTSDFTIRREKSSDAEAISHLLDRAFGVTRFTKTTYRFRDHTRQIDALSFVAIDEKEELVGTIRFWPMHTENGKKVLLLGPLAVAAHFSGYGCGLALMDVGINAAREMGEDLIILIGDEIYYGKAGFNKVPDGHFIFPGPVDDERVLALELTPSSLSQVAGQLHPFKDQ